MAIKCPDCGFSNEDTKLFCGACGEPIAGDAKIARDAERMKEKKERDAQEARKRAEAAAAAQANKSGDDDFVHKPMAKKADNTDLILIIIVLGLFFVLCVCIFVGLEYLF